MEIKDVKNILIFKLCCFGDIMFLTPTISALKRNFPEARITLIASSWITNLKNYLKHVDEVIIFNDVFEKNIFKKAVGAVNMIKVLRKRKFDFVFMGHRKNIFGLIVILSSIKYRLGFSETKFLNLTDMFDENIHETKRYLNILKANGLSIVNEGMKLIQRKSKEEIKKDNNLEKDKFIIGIFPFGGINPGTKMDIKKWDVKNYLRLTKLLSEQYKDSLIFLFEGSQENEKIRETNLPDNVSVEFNFDIISICNIFVSGDTGPLYIPAGFDVSTLSLFGPSCPDLLAPLNYENSKSCHQHIWKKPECSPCYTPITSIDKNNKKYWKGNSFVCYTGTHECINDISVEEVFDKIMEMINRLKSSIDLKEI
jgi:ADP-heptose:LPS heptosyltransferase